jgi:hypothetical protein
MRTCLPRSLLRFRLLLEFVVVRQGLQPLAFFLSELSIRIAKFQGQTHRPTPPVLQALRLHSVDVLSHRQDDHSVVLMDGR